MVVYSLPTCGKCIALKKELSNKGFQYNVNEDKEFMIDLGFTEIPMLEVDGKLMNYDEAIKWISNN